MGRAKAVKAEIAVVVERMNRVVRSKNDRPARPLRVVGKDGSVKGVVSQAELLENLLALEGVRARVDAKRPTVIRCTDPKCDVPGGRLRRVQAQGKVPIRCVPCRARSVGEAVIESRQRRFGADPEAARRVRRQWREAAKERGYKRNPETQRRAARSYRENHLDELRDRERTYRDEHREQLRQKWRERERRRGRRDRRDYYKRNRGKILAKRADRREEINRKRRERYAKAKKK